jgi:hypothetical protein
MTEKPSTEHDRGSDKAALRLLEQTCEADRIGEVLVAEELVASLGVSQ